MIWMVLGLVGQREANTGELMRRESRTAKRKAEDNTEPRECLSTPVRQISLKAAGQARRFNMKLQTISQKRNGEDFQPLLFSIA